LSYEGIFRIAKQDLSVANHFQVCIAQTAIQKISSKLFPAVTATFCYWLACHYYAKRTHP